MSAANYETADDFPSIRLQLDMNEYILNAFL